MEITFLGTASIGGVPEWDCICPNCTAARNDPARRRTRSAITVNTGAEHILFDAGHDLKPQLEANGILPEPSTAVMNRGCSLDSVFLTHGHADHTAGLAEFCTGKSYEVPVYAPPDLIRFLFGSEECPSYFGELGRLAKNYVVPVALEEGVPVVRLGDVTVEGFLVDHTMVQGDGRRYPSSTYAYEIRRKGRRVIYAPDLGSLGGVEERVKGADVFIMDATFWWDDELTRVSGIPVTSYELGHVPQVEAVVALSSMDVGRVVFTHFNHTNPVLDPDEVYREIVENAGMVLAYDGLKIRV